MNKVTLERIQLTRVLTSLRPIANKNHGQINIQSTNNKLILSAHQNNQKAEMNIDANGSLNEDFSLSIKELSDALKGIPASQEIGLMIEDGNLKIEHDNSFKMIDTYQFDNQEINTGMSIIKATIESSALLNQLEEVGKFPSRMRDQLLNVVNLKIGKGCIILTATDGVKLAQSQPEAIREEFNSVVDVNIPRDVINPLKRFLNRIDGNITIEITLFGKELIIKSECGKFINGAYEGTFPNINLIKKPTKYTLEVNKSNILKCLKEVKKNHNKKNGKLCKIKFSQSDITFKSPFDEELELIITHNDSNIEDNEEIEIIYNFDDLGTVLRSMNDDELKLTFDSDESPLLVESVYPDTKSFRYIMPLK